MVWLMCYHACYGLLWLMCYHACHGRLWLTCPCYQERAEAARVSGDAELIAQAEAAAQAAYAKVNRAQGGGGWEVGDWEGCTGMSNGMINGREQ